MARAAKTVRGLSGQSERQAQERTKDARGKSRRGGLSGKTFEELTAKQKDALLKELAVKAGLIDDSDDE